MAGEVEGRANVEVHVVVVCLHYSSPYVLSFVSCNYTFPAYMNGVFAIVHDSH